MEFDGDLAAIHAYLCADGYVIRNPPTQKHRYYCIGLRNTEMALLRDFQRRFYRHFRVKPIITKDGRAKIQRKEIYMRLTADYEYYSGIWSLPDLNKKFLGTWLRAYFDCDGWVYVMKAKDRKIGLDSINYGGLVQIQSALSDGFGISSSIKKRKGRSTWTLSICGRDDLKRFGKKIGFLHPRKKAKLAEAIGSYKDYRWNVPKNKAELSVFVETKGRWSRKRGQIRFNSILKKNLLILKKALATYGIRSRVSKKRINGYGSRYYTLSIRIDQLVKFG